MVYPKLSVDQQKRTGICHGKRCRRKKGKPDVTLYRIADHVYRCIDCYCAERGHKP